MAGDNSSDFPFQEGDIRKLTEALASQRSGGFHLWDFLLGVLFATAMTGILYYRVRNTGLKALNRERQSFAVRALKDMDSKTLKKVLGQVNLPSWVNFPDFERVGWLNSVMGQLWPRVNKALSTMGRQQLDPLMKESKPSWITSVMLDRFDLGDNAPQVSGVKVYQSGASGADEIIMELDFGWTSEAEMSMIVHPMPHQAWLATPVVEILSKLIVVKVGVEKVTLNGRVRITLKPLMDEMPIVAAMQVAFVEMPNFNFDLTLYGGDIGFLPGLEAWITTVIKDSVLRPYVLPDHYTIPVVPGDYNAIDKPRGMLFVTIISAKNVPKMDWFNGSDPYVRLFVRDKRKLKTQIKQNTTKPEWNEEFQLLVHEPEHQHLTLHMFDHDVLSVDDEIGRGSFPIRNLRNGDEEELDIEIKEQKGQKVDQMMIMKLVDKADIALDKVRSLTHFLSKKTHDGPCTLKVKLTYYEFAKEELEQLDNGLSASSMTTSSSDSADDSGRGTPDQHLGQHQRSGDEEEYQQHQHRRPGEEELHRPSGARRYRVHKEDQEEPGETSGARQYRVHREGEQSARVERGSVSNRRSGQTGNEEDRSHRRSSGGWRHHSEKPAHRQALDSHPHDDQSLDQQQGSHQQHSPQSSPGQGNAQHPFGTTQSQAPALSELRHRNSIAEADRVGREGLYTPSRPTSTHDRPRQHTATHERPRTNYQRRQAQDQGDVSDSAYSSQPQSSQPSQSRPDAEDQQWQRYGEGEERPGVGQTGQKEEQAGEGETDQGEDSPLEQSLQLQRSSHRPEARQPNDRVMNILKGGLLYVEIRKASGLISKPLYMLGRPALPDLITVKVTVDGEEKFTAAAKGKDAAIDETLEFILGRKEINAHDDLSVDLEVWDYRLINHFKGRLSIPFKEVVRSKRIKDNYALQGVRHGHLTLSLSWLGISDAK